MTSNIANETTVARRTERHKWSDRNYEVMMLGLDWLRHRLEAYVVQLRASAPPPAFLQVDEKVMADLKADWLLRRPASSPESTAANESLLQARERYEEARDAMREQGEPAAIDCLSALFGLAPFDEDVLLVALAPRLEASFQALYGYAQDRLALAHPTPQLALDLLAPDTDARARARERLAPTAPLRLFSLITLGETGLHAVAPLSIDERLAAYLLGEDSPDPRAQVYLRAIASSPCPRRHEPAIDTLVAALTDAARPAVLIIGPRRCGRRAAAAALAARFGVGLIELDLRSLPVEAEARQATLSLVAREAHLSGLAVVIDAGSPVGAGGEELRRPAPEIVDAIWAGLNVFVIILAEDRLPVAATIPSVRLSALDAADRAEAWRRALGSGDDVADWAIEAVAEQFVLGPAEIVAIAATSPGTDADTLWAACRESTGRGVGTLAQRIEPHYTWDDIILSGDVRGDLEALVAQVRYRKDVYRRWGFARRLPRGRGVTALFSGPSGVGKTMAAEVVARELALDLYNIDLSGVVSKYIGETEKNLRRVFDAAEGAGAVLFFDEADALFGKRTEVKDSHDRYANIEVSYLLQRMEAYTGLAILATNMKSHLDTAFMRRLRFIIDIPFPDYSLRKAIWRSAFPAEAPTDGLDFDALAALEIAGGNITVIAVNAAFLAAAEGAPIRMTHVSGAARAEFRKLDKQFRPSW